MREKKTKRGGGEICLKCAFSSKLVALVCNCLNVDSEKYIILSYKVLELLHYSITNVMEYALQTINHFVKEIFNIIVLPIIGSKVWNNTSTMA